MDIARLQHPSAADTADAAPGWHPPVRPSRLRRALLWGALVALLLVAQSLLVALTISYESARAQDEAETAAAEAAAGVHHTLFGAMQTLQALAWAATTQPDWRGPAQSLLGSRREIEHLEWRSDPATVTAALDTPYAPQLFAQLPRQALGVETEVACQAARRTAAPNFSRSYFVPLVGGLGVELVDLCVPVQPPDEPTRYFVASFSLAAVLESSLSPRQARLHEFSFIEPDGTRLARAGTPRGAGVYRAEHFIDLPGTPLELRADAAAGRPSLIPNLATGLVLGLSIALFGVVIVLARDVRRRAVAERALAEALAFRKAMEDSLSTGLRARDLQGAISYVNPAFCAMVGFSAEELLQPPARADLPRTPPTPPYWPPENAAEYLRRQRLRLRGPVQAAGAGAAPDAREGVETLFMRKNGERFPVMIYEAPLVDGAGRHTGWMSAVLDLSAQRRVEELARQQQDRLQATARLASVGEMASLLSHELNQPLAAIASYASGSLNLLDAPVPETAVTADRADRAGAATPEPAPGLDDLRAQLRLALERIAEQAERAGRVIKSVHDLVRRREQLRETLPAERLFEPVLPLARMHARKSGTRIEIDLPAPPPVGRPLRVRCDRTMVEQVLLNLARNGIQAMEQGTPLAERVLTLRVRQVEPRWLCFSIIDAGPGIAPEVAARLFTPFFTTRAEGMGLGLSLCRTVIEQHGGVLEFGPGPHGRGTEFRFTLPTPASTETGETPVSAATT